MESPSTPPDRQAPAVLTDPAELLALLGRFLAAFCLSMLTIALILNHQWITAAVCGSVALILQMATTRMWRRLREEREARKAGKAEGELPNAEGTR